MTAFLTRRAALGAAAAIAVGGVARLPRAQGLEKFILQTGWRAQAEHGGFYEALAAGLYREAGIDMEIRMGGPQVDSNALLFAGRVDMATGTAFTGLTYVQNNLPFMVVAATFQTDTRVLLSQPGVGNDTLPELRGKPILVASARRSTYWPWLRARFGFTDDQLRPCTFNILPFLVNRQVSMQGLLTSEVMDARRHGVEPVIHALAAHGWRDYQQALTVSRRLAEQKPELLRRMLAAAAAGWTAYLHGDPAPGNAAIKQANRDMDDARIDFSRTTMRERALLDGGDARGGAVGAMTEARWAEFYASMVEAGTLPAGLDPRPAYSLEFLPRACG